MKTSVNTRRAAAAVALAGLAAVPAVAIGQGNQPPRTPAIDIDAKPATIVFGTASTLTGRLRNTQTDRNVLVRLEGDDTRPYGDSYVATGATTRTAQNGTYSFTVRPAKNTQFRVVAESAPPVTSGGRLVLVRMRVGLVLSDSTPRRGQRVRFSGTVAPAHDGASALIQRRSPTGRFATVARATLRDAGDAVSRYSRRLRVRRDGVYRVKVRGDADHINGFSRERTIDVGG